jgi:hypothetical protein
MDYCSLCRKACLGKDFWKIYIGLILSPLLKRTFYFQRHMTLSSADSCCQKAQSLFLSRSLCLSLSVPFPLILKSIKRIPLDSKWYPNFAEVILFVCLYAWFLSFVSNSKLFRVSQTHQYIGIWIIWLCYIVGSIMELTLRFLVTFPVKAAICIIPWLPSLALTY